MDTAHKALHPLRCCSIVGARICTIVTLLASALTIVLHACHEMVDLKMLSMIGGINAAIIAFIKGIELHFDFATKTSQISIAMKDVQVLQHDIVQAIIHEASGTSTDAEYYAIQKDFKKILGAIG